MKEERIIQIMIDLINSIKNVAPEIWAIAIKQSYVYAFQNIATTCFSIIVIILLRKCIYYLIDKHKQNRAGYFEDVIEVLIASSAFSVVIGIGVAIISFINGMSFLINPEYYAIKLLIDLTGIK